MMKRYFIFIFSSFLFLNFIGGCSESLPVQWGISIEIHEGVLDLIKDNPKKEELISIIKKELGDAIYQTINSFDKNKIKNKDGISTSGIIAAWEKLINEIKSGKKSIKIIFAFDSAHYDYYLKLIESKKNKYLELKDIKFVDGAGMTNGVELIYIFNSWRDCRVKLLTATYEGKEYEIGDLIIQFEKYNDSGNIEFKNGDVFYFKKLKKINIYSVIFHEFTHIALFGSTDKNVKSRFCDEATIEDITMKIFSTKCANYYVYRYNTFCYFIKKYKSETIYKEMIKIVINEDGVYFGRNFNPPDNKTYERGVTVNGICAVIEKSYADDCRDSEMRIYVIPVD